MAWSDYFEPDFDDPDSPHYVGDRYLPLFGENMRGQLGFVGDLWEEMSKVPIFDIKNPIHVMHVMSNPFRVDNLRKIAVQLDESDDWDMYAPIDPHPEDEIYHDDSEPNVPNNTQVFDRGKYKGQRVIDVLKFDKSYVDWARTAFLKYKR